MTEARDDGVTSPASERAGEHHDPWAPPFPGAPVPSPRTASAWESGKWKTNGPYAPFGAPLAGWWQRVGALVLDSLVLLVPLAVLDFIVSAATATPHHVTVNGILIATRTVPGSVTAAITLLSVVAGAAYFAGFNGLGAGQTPGNRAPGIAVRDVRTGQPIGFWRGLLRWFVRSLLYGALILPGIVNDLFPLWNARRQTLADMAARSVMVKLD